MSDEVKGSEQETGGSFSKRIVTVRGRVAEVRNKNTVMVHLAGESLKEPGDTERYFLVPRTEVESRGEGLTVTPAPRSSTVDIRLTEGFCVRNGINYREE